MNNFNFKGMVFMNDDKTAAIIIYLFKQEQKQLRINHKDLTGRSKRILEMIRIIRQTQEGADYGSTKIDTIGN